MHIYLVFGVFDGIKGSIYDVMGVQNHDKLEQKQVGPIILRRLPGTSVTRKIPRDGDL